MIFHQLQDLNEINLRYLNSYKSVRRKKDAVENRGKEEDKRDY